jgi:hypothetical protein
MRQIFVQSCDTKLFLAEGNTWTAESMEARNFGTSLNALVHCVQHKLHEMQIVVRFDTPGAADVVLSVQNESDVARPTI